MTNLRNVLIGMKRNAAMSLASILLVTLTLFVSGIIGIITLNVSYISGNVVSGLNIYAYLENGISDEDKARVESEIATISDVDNISFSSKEEELELLSTDLGDEQTKILDFFQGENNPLKDLYIVNVNKDSSLDVVAKEIELINGIDTATYGDINSTNNFVNAMNVIKSVSLVLAIFLIIVSTFIIVNTIKLTITSRKLEIEIMRLVGATKMYVRFPFIIEGMLIGFIGGIISFVTISLAYYELVNGNLIVGLNTILISPTSIVFMLLFGLILGGILIGSFGSYVATMKYLKK